VGAWDAVMPNTATAATKLYDAVGSADGTMYNGSCLDVDGTNDYVINSSFTDHQSSSGTIVVWANADSLTGGTYVFGVGGTATYGGSRAMRFYLNKLSLVGYGGATEDYNDFGPTLVTGQWYHVAYVWSGTSVTGYVDGVGYSTTLSGLVTPTGTRVTAGEAPWDGGYFNGQVADARMYNVALSAANIKEFYDDSKVIIPYGVSQTNLKCWWPMIDAAGTIAYDGSGNGNDGTLTNMDAATDWLTGQTGCPQLVEGYNRPFLFDADGYVDMALTLDAVTDYTFSWWSRHTSQNNPNLFTSGGSSTGGFNLNWAGSTDRPILYLAGSNYAYFTDNAAQDDGQWHHWLLTYEGTATSGREAIDSKLYIDGVNQSITSAATGAVPTTWGTFRIGRGSGAGTFYGNLNEFIIYNGQLGSSDRAALYVRGPNGGPLPPDPMSLSNSSDVLAYWRNDGNVTWADRGTSGYTGTVGGSPDDLLFKQGYNGQKSTSTGRDGQGFPLSRQNNGAIGFDGTTTYTDAGSVGGAGTFSNCTISVWVNPRNIVGATSHGRIYDGNYEPSIRQRGPTLQLNGTVAASQTYLFYLGADISNYFSAGNMTAPKGQWTNITMTVTTVGTASQSVNGYVNLTLEGTGSTTDSAKMWVGDIGNLRIGQGYKTGQRFFVGQIGNLQIWDRVLTLPEITQNFNAQRSRFNV